MWGSYIRHEWCFEDYKYFNNYHYKKELYPTAVNPGGRTDETHQFILQLNDKKFKNVKFVKKENKKAMTHEEILEYKNRKSMRKIVRKNNREIKAYFDFN